MSDIPTDAYREILRRVPVDFLFQLRLVCKSWRSIIDDPQFAKMHIHRGIGDCWILHKNKTGKFFLISLKHMIHHKNKMSTCRCDKSRMESCVECSIEWVEATHIKAVAGSGIPKLRNLPAPCCNGLVLITSPITHFVWVIWNPFTGESLKLPVCDEITKYDFNCHHRGLGYDNVNDDYKVVRIFETQTFIYSVNSRAWRRNHDFPKDCRIGSFMYNGVFIYGALHWVAYTAGERGDSGWIIAFNLTTEAYRKIAVPLEIGIVVSPYALTLIALSGCLFLISRNMVGLFVVWKINDYNGCDLEQIWTKVMSLSLEFEHAITDLSLVAYLKDENRLLLCYSSDTFFWYDVENAQISRVSLEVNPDINGCYHNYHNLRNIYNPSSQIIPASLVRLERNDCANEDIASTGKSFTRKRKRTNQETLRFKISFDSLDGILGE